MRLAAWAIRRPVTTAMVFVSMVAIGAIASRLLPMEFFPEVDAPFIFVQMPYPGSTPQEVERLLTRPAEEALATIRGIQSLNSRSSGESGDVFLVFDWGTDVAIKSVEVRDKLEGIRGELPDDLRRINVFKFNTSDQPVFTLRISSERDLSEAYDLLNRNLVRPLQRLPGVARVTLEGVEPKEININLLASRISALGIDLNELNRRLSQANFSASAGLVDEGELRYRVNPVGEFRDIESIRNFVINDRGVRLSDVAEVTYLPGELVYRRHLDRRNAIGVSLFKERGANLVEVSRSALDEIERIGKTKEMQGITLFFLNDAASGVVSSLGDLLNAGLVGALLSFLVLYAFLRNLAATLMVVLAVPISITVTLGVMYFLGLSLNVLTMMGLMLAVGMLVDNAVVVSESIFRQRELHPGNPRQAALDGSRMVGLAVVAGTITSAAVFLPNIFGEKDQISIFLSHVAVAICVSLAASLLIALTIIPLLASRVKPPQKRTKETWIEILKNAYGRVLSWTLKHRWATFGFIILVLVSSALPISLVKKEMFPEDIDRDLFLRYNLDSSYPMEKIKKSAIDPIEDYLYANQERLNIRAVYSFYSEQEIRAESSILLTPEDEATLSSSEIKKIILEELPKIPIGQPTFDEERQGGAEGVSLAITGDSSERLLEIVPDVVSALRSIPGLTEVKSEYASGDREIGVHVDRIRASQYGFNAQQVASFVAVALRGSQLREFRGPDGEVPITLKFQNSDSQTIDQLAMLTLRTAEGAEVPVSAVADLKIQRGPPRVLRQDRQTAIGITASLEEDMTMDDAREAIKEMMDSMEFPPGYGWKYGRGFSIGDDAGEKMAQNILLAILLIFLVMAGLFESVAYPLSIISSIAFSIIGVFWFFLLTGTTFSLMANIGILILIGVVVNNGIVLVDHMNQLRWQGLPRDEAIVQAGRDRLRPILMTVATTVLGLVPLCIGTTQLGGDGPPYFPMARAIVGGLVFSTVVSLLAVPFIYSALDDLRLWGKARLAEARQRKSRWLNTRPRAATK